MVRLFSGKKAGLWGRATGVVMLIFAVAFVLWAKIEVPNYERQQAKINYQAGMQYLQDNDDENALNSFLKITKYDQTTYATVQPQIKELQSKLALAKLAEAQNLYADQQYPQALQALKISLQYTELEESKALLPAYEAAAGQK
jgi:Tfp pilus assembly protein PilF